MFNSFPDGKLTPIVPEENLQGHTRLADHARRVHVHPKTGRHGLRLALIRQGALAPVSTLAVLECSAFGRRRARRS